MNFYFIVHTLLGIAAMSAAITFAQALQNPASTPTWAWGKTGMQIAGCSLAGVLLAMITTLMNFGFLWTLATVAEIFLGCIIAFFLPTGLRFMFGVASPVVTVVILGALWKFWYL
jgi:hypothetical protein